jgi:hypothetical protein
MRLGHGLKEVAAEAVPVVAAVAVVAAAKVPVEEVRVADAAAKVPVGTGVVRVGASEPKDTMVPGRIPLPTALWREGA